MKLRGNRPAYIVTWCNHVPVSGFTWGWQGKAHGLAITASGCLPPLHNDAAAAGHVPTLPRWADESGRAAPAAARGLAWRDARRALAPAELTLVQCAASPDYWLLFGVLGAGTGCGLLFSNNLGAWRWGTEAWGHPWRG